MSPYNADDLLTDATLNAAVTALASRNAHHLQDMSQAEQVEAAGHWRALAMDVLVAVRAQVTNPGEAPAGSPEGPGRAVIVLEDAGQEEINVHVAFHPELQDMGGDQVAGTPAQITAVSMLDTLGEEAPGPDA